MLIIKSLNPTGMFSFGDAEDINMFDRGLISLQGINKDSRLGSSNGAGKSSLFNSLCELLYRQNPTGVSGDGVVNNLWDCGFAGRVVFRSWEQIDYRVTYCRKFKKNKYPEDNDNRTEYKGTQLFLEKLVGGQWVDYRGSSMQETSKRVQEALGLTYDQFIAVAYMTPRQGNILLRGSNKDRLDVLTGLVGLEVWDDILAQVRLDKKRLTQEQEGLRQKMSYIEGEMSQISTQLQQINPASILEDISDCNVKAKEQEGHKQNEEDKLKDLDAELVKTQQDRVDAWTELGLDTRQKEMASIQNDISSLKVEKSALRTSINPALAEEFHAAESSLNQARGTLTAVKGSNKLVDVENCPTCGSTITKAARAKMEKTIKSAEIAVIECEKRVNAVKISVENDKAEQEKTLQGKQVELDNKIADLQKKLGNAQQEYTTKSNEYNAFGAKIQVVRTQADELRQRVSQFDQVIAQWKARAEALKSSVDTAKAWEGQLREKEQQKSDLNLQVTQVGDDISHYDWFITNIPYIKLHKLSVALQDLSSIANSYLKDMGDTATIQIFSFKEKQKAKSGLKIDQLKSEINIVIEDGEKNIDPRLYSDGETARFSVALVRAMHDLALKHGHGCNLVLLDEIFSYVDGSNSQIISDSFSQVLQTGSTCIVTDNSGIAANLMNFEGTWTVTKVNGLSTLTE